MMIKNFKLQEPNDNLNHSNRSQVELKQLISRHRNHVKKLIANAKQHQIEDLDLFLSLIKEANQSH